MTSTLFIVNDAPYGTSAPTTRCGWPALAAREGQSGRPAPMADAVGCANGQKVPEGYYNVQLMLGKVLRKGEARAVRYLPRGLRDEELIDGTRRGTMVQSADCMGPKPTKS